VLSAEQLPAEPIAVLGPDSSRRIDTLVHDMVESSHASGEIVQGPEGGPAMAQLRDFMFEHVYLGPAVRAEHEKIANVLRTLFEHYVEHPELLPYAGTGRDEGAASLARRVIDYLAGMTDRYCIGEYTRLAVPQAFAR
jgi:dGTPase